MKYNFITYLSEHLYFIPFWCFYIFDIPYIIIEYFKGGYSLSYTILMICVFILFSIMQYVAYKQSKKYLKFHIDLNENKIVTESIKLAIENLEDIKYENNVKIIEYETDDKLYQNGFNDALDFVNHRISNKIIDLHGKMLDAEIEFLENNRM